MMSKFERTNLQNAKANVKHLGARKYRTLSKMEKWTLQCAKATLRKYGIAY